MIEFPNEITINVTKRDIEKAQLSWKDYDNKDIEDVCCPIEVSVNRRFPDFNAVASPKKLVLRKAVGYKRAYYIFPENAQKLMMAFDTDQEVKPLKFKVKLNEIK